MTEQKARQRFAELQSKAQQTAKAAQDYAIRLRVKYGDAYYRGYLGKKATHRLDILQRANTRAVDRFFALLDTIGGRQFRSGVPCHWLIEKLTYEDAVTRGQMSAVPPPAWGCSDADMPRFAAPVRTETIA